MHLVHGEADVNPVCMLKFIEISCMFHTKKIINMKGYCLIFVTMIVMKPEPTILIVHLSSM